MDNGWLELESDPGLFTLLLEDIGVQGVQVEEIYDLTKDIEGPVYGFIFLFKWIEERRSRRKIAQDEESFVTEGSVVNSMFFAQQLIPNSCATHALLSVLLNCDDKLKLSDTLIKLKSFTWGMNPQDKGFAIGNMPELAKAHNKYARPEPRQMRDKQPGISVRTKEAFHFVSYVPINGRLFELDGLRPHPIDHGPWGEQEEWTEKFRRVISERLGMAGGEAYQDIRFNLMAVVTDRRLQYEQKLRTLKTNRQIVLEALQQMVKVTSPHGDMRSRGESVVTRSVAAKEAATSSISLTQTQPLRSARLRQKAAAAAAAAAAIDNEVITLDGDGMSDSMSSALDGHNYAMSPKVEIEEEGVGSAAIDEMDMVSEHKSAIMIDSSPSVDINQLSAQRLKTEREVKIHISVSDDKDGKVTVTQPSTVANTDVTKPLMIQTKFTNNSPGPGSSSTDTASEVGSLLNSPVLSTGQYSPSFSTISPSRLNQHHNEHTNSCKHDLTDRLSVDTHDIDIKDLKATSDHMRALRLNSGCMKMDSDISPGKDSYSSKSSSTCQLRSKFGTKQGFTPKDLLALLKNVESEVSQCETNLRDEIEKRRKYKVDACRRTHNYDQFVFTFLSMLAEQGQLAELVEPQIQTKRRQSVSGSNNSSTAKSTATSVKLNRIKKPDRKRAKPKKRR